MPIIDAALAGRAKLHTGSPLLGKNWGFEIGFLVGSTVIRSPTAVGKLTLGAAPFARRIAWNGRRYQPDADGVIGPGGVLEPVVRFQLRAPLPGERTVALPMVDDWGLFGSWGARYASVDVGGMHLRVRFSPRNRRSYLSASVAPRIAEALGGKLDGAAEEMPIAFGIARPVRTMMLARPLIVGPLALARVGVRVAEGATGAIPEAGAKAPEADPDEVVVVARDKRHARPGSLTLGADTLARCSSLVFDKPARQVRLTCG